MDSLCTIVFIAAADAACWCVCLCVDCRLSHTHTQNTTHVILYKAQLAIYCKRRQFHFSLVNFVISAGLCCFTLSNSACFFGGGGDRGGGSRWY